MPPEWNACARQSRVCPCYTTWCAPIIRCRSASLAVVQPNHRLPEHSTMRRAKQCRYFASSLPPSKRHSRLTIVRRGCDWSRLAEDSWRSHVHRTYIAQRVQLFKLQSANVGVKGQCPLRLPLYTKNSYFPCKSTKFEPEFRLNSGGFFFECVLYYMNEGSVRCKTDRNQTPPFRNDDAGEVGIVE